jgi:hypothetical protein
MKRYLVLLLAVLFIFDCKLNAQILKPLPISYFQGKARPIVFGQFQRTYEGVFYSNTWNANPGMSLSPEWNFKYTLPRGAVFCRMEEALYNRLNFWVKIRMGTDERYSN